MQRQLNKPLAVGQKGLRYTVRPGMTLNAIANELADKGILEHPKYFAFEARRQGKASQIQAGQYQLATATTPLKLLDMFIKGRVIQYTFTLVEGWNFKQMIAAIAAEKNLIHTLGNASADEIMRRIGDANVHPEGRFFPDTYYFTAGTTDVQMLRRAYRTMEHELERAWQGRDAKLPYTTPYEALIMASIVEKETAKPEERAQIAGVFVRRLKVGMKLQTDPTVIYALRDTFDGNLRRRDLGIDSPYNTYRHKGLTPTPIAMPSAAAIHAALHPGDGDALYFVAKGDGSHQFSTTLREHNWAVARYQRRASAPSRLGKRDERK